VTGEQATLERFDDTEDGDAPTDDLDALRRDVARITEHLDTLAKTQLALVDTVGDSLSDAEDGDAVDTDAAGRPSTWRGFE